MTKNAEARLLEGREIVHDLNHTNRFVEMLLVLGFLSGPTHVTKGGILFLPIRYKAINDKDENINFKCERKRRLHFIGTDILSL